MTSRIFCQRSFKLFAIAVIMTTSVGLCWSTARAAAASAAGTCNGLSVQLSDDKNYNVFTASATANAGSTIAGYEFTFGDQQSYSFTFAPNQAAPRDQATVTHTYAKNGEYTASVAVELIAAGKTTAVTSPQCSVPVAVGEQLASAPVQLVNTGPQGALTVFLLSAALGYVSERCVLRLIRGNGSHTRPVV
jgi:plastocyanin